MNENPQYLKEQLITYIGNKRALLDFIQSGVDFVLGKTEKKKLTTFDVFSGSGIVSRFLKKYSTTQYANDMEDYARIISTCYLSNKKETDWDHINKTVIELNETVQKKITNH